MLKKIISITFLVFLRICLFLLYVYECFAYMYSHALIYAVPNGYQKNMKELDLQEVWTPCECWKLYLSSLKGQQMLLMSAFSRTPIFISYMATKCYRKYCNSIKISFTNIHSRWRSDFKESKIISEKLSRNTHE